MTNRINEIFKAFAPEYIKRFPNMPKHHRKTIHAIVHCRSGTYGTTVYHCAECGHLHFIARSCGNRHCPQCQYHKTREWLDKQLARQVPVHHFMITFTVPQEIRSIIRQNQKVAYQALFKASSEALKKLAADERFIGTNLPGFTGVLHTWGRQLQYHPHIHYIVPGGGLSKDRNQWIPSPQHFFVHVKALSVLFRALFMKEMENAGLKPEIPAAVWRKKWVVNSQAVGGSGASVRYLAPYVFRVAISNSRIIKVEDRYVYFKYKKHGSRQWKTTRLEVMEFIHRFLQHVLPSGFMKVRHYGFMNPSSRVSHETVLNLIEQRTGESLPPVKPSVPPQQYCRDCGGKLEHIWSIIPDRYYRE
jgi:uncharacterized OB-fold protein